MPKAIRVHQPGGPEALRWEDVSPGAPGPGQVRLRHTFVGLNFIDVYHRNGLYKLPLPFTPGQEGAGIVVAVGADVTGFGLGDRVAYGTAPPGAYAEERLVPADRLVALPPGIDDRTAAAMMLKGLTAQYLLRQTYLVKPGDTILVQAAAGGVGLIVCQWAKHLGATVIGTVSSDDKAALARAHGCDHTIVYTRENFVDRVKEITAGRGLSVVYDSVGQETFLRSLDCLSPRGLMVLYGASSGPVAPFDIMTLAQKGSLFLTRPSLFSYAARPDDLRAMAADLFAVVQSGAVKIRASHTWPLRDARLAHAALEARQTTGSTVLSVA